MQSQGKANREKKVKKQRREKFHSIPFSIQCQTGCKYCTVQYEDEKDACKEFRKIC